MYKEKVRGYQGMCEMEEWPWDCYKAITKILKPQKMIKIKLVKLYFKNNKDQVPAE